MLLHLPIWQHFAYVFMAGPRWHRLENALLGERPGKYPAQSGQRFDTSPESRCMHMGRATRTRLATRSEAGASRRREHE